MRHAMLMIAVFIASLAAPAAAQAATATTTTLDVPSGTQYGSFTVTAHVTPPPQPTNGFLPGVLFIVDGGGGLPAPLDSNGDASLELSLDPGSHTIKASFGPFADWEASESAAEGVQVGVATQVQLASNHNPALATQSVTITATVSPSSVTGGTVTIVDAFDGSTLASGAVGPGDTSVSFTGSLDAGSHALTATYTGHGDHGPSEGGLTQTIQADSGRERDGRGPVHDLLPGPRHVSRHERHPRDPAGAGVRADPRLHTIEHALPHLRSRPPWRRGVQPCLEWPELGRCDPQGRDVPDRPADHR